jgi:hypothetical protein
MDMIDILGGILGQKTGSPAPSGGGKILKDILGGNSPSRGRSSEVTTAGRSDIAGQAKELEDLLNVAGNRSQSRPGNFGGGSSGGISGSSGGTSAGRSFPSGGPFGGMRQADAPPPIAPTDRSSPFSTPRRETPPPATTGGKKLSANEEAELLIKAMLNAAKCDQQISETEQQAIFQQIGDPTPEVLNYLRQEIQKPLDVRDFAWSVPVGMEQKVYSISIMAMDLKTPAEARYLEELAHGLRLSPEVRAEIHRHYGLSNS